MWPSGLPGHRNLLLTGQTDRLLKRRKPPTYRTVRCIKRRNPPTYRTVRCLKRRNPPTYRSVTQTSYQSDRHISQKTQTSYLWDSQISQKTQTSCLPDRLFSKKGKLPTYRTDIGLKRHRGVVVKKQACSLSDILFSIPVILKYSNRHHISCYQI